MPAETSPTDDDSTALISTADQCLCLGRIRFRPPAVLLPKLRFDQDNRCYYRFAECTGQVEVVAHLCHNPPCRNVKHLVGSCDHCNKSISNVARPAQTRYAKDSVCVENSEDNPDSLAINREREPAWINYVTRRLTDEEKLFQRILDRESANFCNISIETVRKYRLKWVAPELNYDGPGNFLFEAGRDHTTGRT